MISLEKIGIVTAIAVDGYESNRTYRCITRTSFEEIARQKQERGR